MEVTLGQASRTGRQSRPGWLEEFQSGRLGAIGPIPYSTTPRQLSDALWTWSGGVGTPLEGDHPEGPPNRRRKRSWSDLAAWALTNRRQRWNSPYPVERSSSGRKCLDQGKREQTFGTSIKQQRDQPQGGAADFDPWLNKTAQGTAPAAQKNPWQGWKGTTTNEKREEMQVRQDPPVNIMEMVTKKCEEMKREILVEVGTILDQTRGELAGAAIQMRTMQEAMTNQQAKMSKVEEVITTTAASAAADQRKTQDMVERMMRMVKEKEKRNRPDSDELEDDRL